MPEKSVEQLTQDNTALAAENARLKGELETAQTVIDELKEQVRIAEQGQAVPTVKAGKDTYQVLSDGFKFKGKDITLADLKKDSDLVEQLAEAGCGFLVLVEKPSAKK